MTWRVVAGSAVGTSHLETNTPCQDRFGSHAFHSTDGTEILVLAVSDGAGSAACSDAGAELICETLLCEVQHTFAETSDFDAVDDEHIRSWFVAARWRIGELAVQEGRDIRDYAATAILGVFGEHQTICAQVGDGGIVVRQDGMEVFEAAIWPESGEYVNQTFFVTDQNLAERVQIRRFDRILDAIAFSDGLQNIALDSTSRSAHFPFFRPIVDHVRNAAVSGRDLEAELVDYLGSGRVTARTDDDKSLVIGCRL